MKENVFLLCVYQLASHEFSTPNSFSSTLSYDIEPGIQKISLPLPTGRRWLHLPGPLEWGWQERRSSSSSMFTCCLVNRPLGCLSLHMHLTSSSRALVHCPQYKVHLALLVVPAPWGPAVPPSEVPVYLLEAVFTACRFAYSSLLPWLTQCHGYNCFQQALSLSSHLAHFSVIK